MLLQQTLPRNAPHGLIALQERLLQQQQAAGDTKALADEPPEPSAALPLATFTAGLGMGLTLMALLKRRD